ncbi:AaceriABL026Wp [[Ashbya] aceris (nom. inval.)]|nr:AaceriABL026Wp [[Ashbya] aceris (nom. inval.)]
MAGYLTFCHNEDDREFSEEAGGVPHGLPRKKRDSDLYRSPFLNLGQANVDEVDELEQLELPRMSRFEVELYLRAKEFQAMNPPIVKAFGTYMCPEDRQCVRDRGIQAYYLLPSINDNVDRRGNFLPSFLIQDKLNISFTKYNKSSSTIMNYPLPYNKRDAVYFEVKVYKFKNYLASNSIFSIGLVTCPYPYFVMPGMCQYSIAYESTGKLRINNAFYASTLLPKLQEGDVVGLGYRYRTGTVFITHNGKKMMDLTHNIGIDLFIGIGAMNAAYTRTYTKEGLLDDIDNVELRTQIQDLEADQKRDITEIMNEQLLRPHDPRTRHINSDEIELQVNLGGIGFVFVEANVKKYAFGSLYGEIGIPPAYNGDETKTDVILQKGDDLPPKYPEDELNFFGNIKVNLGNGSSTESTSIYNRQGSSGSIAAPPAHERPRSLQNVPYALQGLLDDIEERSVYEPLLPKGPRPAKSGHKRKKRKRRAPA